MDVRGSGASYGVWPYLWSEEEAADSAEVLDWLQQQSWSSGRALLFGQSYDANAALNTAARGHPAVAAVVAVNPFLEPYDITQPGGVPLAYFAQRWSQLIRAFDSQRTHTAPGQAAGVACLVRGFARVQPPEEAGEAAGKGWSARRARRAAREAALRAAVAQRAANWDPQADTEGGVEFRDDTAPRAGVSCAQLSFAPVLARLAAGDAPLLWTSGWHDATVASAAAGFAATRGVEGSRLLVGPWTHTLWQQVAAGGARLTSFPFPRETLAFMLRHSRSRAAAVADAAPGAAAAADGARVRLFEQGSSGRGWLALPDWPATASVDLTLGPDHALLLPGAAAEGEGRDAFAVRRGARPSGFSRWQAMLNVGSFVRYSGWSALPLRYASAPLRRPLRLCGSPVLRLALDSSDGQGDIFAYLLDCDASGALSYVAEGCLRASHRAEAGGEEATRLPQSQPALPRHSHARADAAPPLPPPPQPGGGEGRAHGGPPQPQTVRLALMPACHAFGAGHRLVLALSGADAKHFTPEPGSWGRTLGVSWGGATGSALSLPVLLGDQEE